MSYGFHRLGSNVDPIRAKERMGQIAARQFGVHVIDDEGEITESFENVFDALDIAPPPEPKATKTTDVGDARSRGYSGDVCRYCQGSRVKWAGHCMVCDDCGETTGCS